MQRFYLLYICPIPAENCPDISSPLNEFLNKRCHIAKLYHIIFSKKEKISTYSYIQLLALLSTSWSFKSHFDLFKWKFCNELHFAVKKCPMKQCYRSFLELFKCPSDLMVKLWIRMPYWYRYISIYIVHIKEQLKKTDPA